jgi:hypothetical protein
MHPSLGAKRSTLDEETFAIGDRVFDKGRIG